MTIQQLIFLALAVLIIGAALFVVTTRNLFRGALFLIVSFFSIAGLYVLLDAGFFAVAQVLVYIGAISILIIFGVMLTRGMQGMIPRNSQAVGAAVVTAIIFGVLLLLLGPLHLTINGRDFGSVAWAFANQPVSPEYIGKLGIAFVDVNQYALPFELASVLILLVLIGSVWVARERRPTEVIEDRMEVSAEEAAEKAEIEAANAAPALPETATAHGTAHGSDH